ncbi:MAG: sigma-54-dependent Fis family transcriptional regulator [Deltaproteobacteria bacterium]|nr:sigma-54-dependent Fis family transcriptional regulator [Deltaproteobacteria bacterium]
MDLQGEETIESEELPVHVLLVEDEPDLRSSLRYNLKRNGYAVTDVGNGQEALTALKADGPPVEIVVSDVMMPVMDGHALVRAVRSDQATAELPFMFLTAKGDTADRVEGFRLGADDYLTKPFDIEELLARVQVLARRAYTARRMRKLLPALGTGAEKPGLVKQTGDLYAKVAEWERRFPQLAVIRNDSIVGASMRTMLLLREILVRAPGKDPVLIIGETGTGKTGVAEALHRLGPRADKPFRVVNCAELGAADHAITAGRLFGFGKGSGLANVAKEGQPGLLEDVDGGTLFFDEIHRLPLDAQAMLLLPIEGRPFHPAVGKGEPRTVDVKFIFATNVDLRAESQAGRFPFDLYQRLAQSQIRVPALAERREDIATLAAHFLDECKGEYELQHATFAPSLLKHLVERRYDGNIRELRNIVREIARRAAFELDTLLTLEHLPEAWDKVQPAAGSAPEPVPEVAMPVAAAPPGTDDDGDGFWHELEMQELRALRRHRFKIAAAEVELGLSSKSRTLTNHLRGMCFKALCSCEQGGRFDVRGAALLVVGRSDAALLDRTVERLESYLDMVEKHAAAHTVETLFNNLPRDYRKHVERAIELAREKLQR